MWQLFTWIEVIVAAQQRAAVITQRMVFTRSCQLHSSSLPLRHHETWPYIHGPKQKQTMPAFRWLQRPQKWYGLRCSEMHCKQFKTSFLSQLRLLLYAARGHCIEGEGLWYKGKRCHFLIENKLWNCFKGAHSPVLHHHHHPLQAGEQQLLLSLSSSPGWCWVTGGGHGEICCLLYLLPAQSRTARGQWK